MNERLLQFIWRFQHYNAKELTLSSGEPLKVIHAGTWNHHQGPDFTDARIRVGNTTWAGNVELHVKASDWYRHAHADDPNYHNIILHVVWQEDTVVKDNCYQFIPTLVLSGRVSGLLLDRYGQMMETVRQVPCHHFLPGASELTWFSWKERLMAERLERKSAGILKQLQQTDHHWDEVFWRQLAMGFGSKTNAVFFEQVAKSIPYNILQRHRNIPEELEALLFGQAQLLNKKRTDAYPQKLVKTYHHLQRKYKLVSPGGQPAFLRMRPASFPTIRLSQLSMLIHLRENLFYQVRNIESTDNLVQLFHVKASQYWNHHYRFDESAVQSLKWIGRQMTIHLLINSIVPMVFTYGLEMQQQVYKDKCLQWLYSLEAEQNRITRYWQSAGIHNRSALDSQALIELNTQYCVNKRCLDCAIGNKLLSQ